ncbi:MAG: hypothetical protein DI534_16135 [Leifsonia xyli]|nr:MAG: hypothetical protein DI534_16135 [Leifsonia xyli]
MAFTISARTLLELGKELISSDDVALYELIKNAVDAGSAKIEIRAQVTLPQSAYKSALDRLNLGHEPDDIFRSLAQATLPEASSVGASAFLNALRPAIGDKDKFRAALQKAYVEYNWISVRDWGHGMSLEDLDKIFLRIGTHSRRARNVTGSSFLGDKGVGRLSAMRLGDRLHVLTTRSGDDHWHELDIDWSRFSHESDVDLGSIDIEPENGDVKTDRSEQGTTITIRDLAGDWSFVKFDEMMGGRIARLIDPFSPGRANQLLSVHFDKTRVLVPSIPKSLLESAHATLKITFDFDEDGTPVLKGLIDYRLRNAKRPVEQRGAEIYSIAQQSVKRRGKKGHAAQQAIPIDPRALRDLGPFTCDIYWYNRRVVDAVAGLSENRSETQRLVGQWSGGPMLYRHDFRVLPYGDPDDDWLELDRNAFGASGFKLNRQQVIGKVGVRSAHTALSEQTNREGLIESDAAAALKTIVMWLLHVEMRGLINEADKAEILSKRDAEESALEFRETQEAVETALAQLKARIPKEDKPYLDVLEREVTALAGQCAALLSRLDEAVTESREEREKFVHLAGIGLITEFIFHELDRAVAHTLRLLTEAKQGQREAALSALEDQLKTLQKRVSAFDDLSGERRQTRSEVDVVQVVSTVLEGHANEFERHGIAVELEAGSHPLKVKAVRGMLVQILENLLSNSVYWLKQQVRLETGFHGKITIAVDPDERTVTVEDNGGGVAKNRAEAIFEPFITSKPPGQGRGLGLYISRDMAEHHGWTLSMDKVSGRVRPNRLNMFVLDMGGGK